MPDSATLTPPSETTTNQSCGLRLTPEQMIRTLYEHFHPGVSQLAAPLRRDPEGEGLDDPSRDALPDDDDLVTDALPDDDPA